MDEEMRDDDIEEVSVSDKVDKNNNRAKLSVASYQKSTGKVGMSEMNSSNVSSKN